MTLPLYLFALIIHFVLWRKGFFTLPRGSFSSEGTLSFSEVLTSFLIYFACFYGVLLLLFNLLSPLKLTDPKLLIALLQIGVAALALSTWLTLFLKKNHFHLLWSSPSPLQDIGLAIVIYCLSLPIIACINESAEQLNLYFFGYKGEDQGAVLYLRSVKENPLTFSLTLISIIIIAPVVEEVLFRGLLQRYIKRWLGIKAALLLTSLSFALMHFQLAQGIGNIPLLTSLFIFALYLGFIYEKKKSLVASMTLHFIFNLVSVIRISVV